MPQIVSVISPNMVHRAYNTFTLTMTDNVYQSLVEKAELKAEAVRKDDCGNV